MKPTLARFAPLIVAVAFPGWCHAQLGSVPSTYTNSQLSTIRNQAIGTGYTIESLNRINLRETSGQVFNVANRDITPAANPVGSPGVSAPARSAASFNSFGSMGTSSKPFANSSRGPTVSPYMNLFRDDFNDEFDNYNALVRPILQQQQINRSLELQTQSIDRRVQSMAAKPAFNPEGSTTQSPTGHPTGFMYHSHYYPGLQPQRRR